MEAFRMMNLVTPQPEADGHAAKELGNAGISSLIWSSDDHFVSSIQGVLIKEGCQACRFERMLTAWKVYGVSIPNEVRAEIIRNPIYLKDQQLIVNEAAIPVPDKLLRGLKEGSDAFYVGSPVMLKLLVETLQSHRLIDIIQP